MVGALIEKTHMEKVLRYIEEGKKSGAKLIRGGYRKGEIIFF
jgi:acyl-CoA reductase-like NAD-dependent aldehyde dehydrogenase